MAITEATMPLEEMKRVVKEGYVCQECQAMLSVAWGGTFGVNSYVLRCSKAQNHQGISKPYQIPISQNSDIIRYTNAGNKQRRILMEKYGEEKGKSIVRYQGVTALARNQAMEILEAIWPEAPEPEKIRAALLCATQGLNPLMKHVFLIPFNKDKKNETWATVIGINAKRLMASRRGAFSYVDDTPRVMTDGEQIKRFGKVKEGKLVVIVRLQDPVTGAIAVGYGDWVLLKPHMVWDDQSKRMKPVFKDGEQIFVPNDPYGSDKGNDMFNMAAIRAESQALSRLRPGDTPEGIVAMDESFAEIASEQGIQDDNTIDAEAKEIPEDEPPPETEINATEAKVKKQPKPPKAGKVEPVEKQETPAESVQSKSGRSDGKDKGNIPEEHGSGIITVKVLKEKLDILAAKVPKTWGTEPLVAYMKQSYKVEGTDPLKMAGALDEGQLNHFVSRINSHMQMV